MRNNFYRDEYGFLVYKTTTEDLSEIQKRYSYKFANSNLLNNKTIYNSKDSRLAGIAAEYVFGLYFKSATDVTSKNLCYDFLVPSAVDRSPLKVDVKSKTRNVYPKPYFDATIYDYQQTGDFFKDVDIYVFMSTIKDLSKVWFCGMLLKSSWLDNPNKRFWRKGDIDPSNGKKFIQDAWTLSYKELISI